MLVDTNLLKLKVGPEIFGVGMVKNGCEQSGQGTLKLTVSQEWIDGMNWFFAYCCKFKTAESYFNDGPGQKRTWSFSSWDPKISWMSL